MSVEHGQTWPLKTAIERTSAYMRAVCPESSATSNNQVATNDRADTEALSNPSTQAGYRPSQANDTLEVQQATTLY